MVYERGTKTNGKGYFMEIKSSFQIARECDHLSGTANIKAINKAFRLQDDSKKWPISGRFNATDRAINRLAKVRKEMPIEGLEYALALDTQIGLIVNDPKL